MFQSLSSGRNVFCIIPLSDNEFIVPGSNQKYSSTADAQKQLQFDTLLEEPVYSSKEEVAAGAVKYTLAAPSGVTVYDFTTKDDSIQSVLSSEHNIKNSTSLSGYLTEGFRRVVIAIRKNESGNFDASVTRFHPDDTTSHLVFTLYKDSVAAFHP